MNKTNHYLSLLLLGVAERKDREIRNLERLLLGTNLNFQLLRLSSLTIQMPYPEKSNKLYYRRIRRYRPLVSGDR